MLRRDQHIRTQLNQIADACIFSASFLFAYLLRSDPRIIDALGLIPATPFNDFAKLFFVLFPGAPLILEWQGFYNRAPLAPRSAVLWPLLKGCAVATLGLIAVGYVFQLQVARTIMIAFGCISFFAVFAKEEIVRLFLKSKMAQSQYRRRFIVAGNDKEIAKMRQEIEAQGDEGIEIVAELNMNQMGAQELIQLLHEHSAYGVILRARHTYFEQIENVIKACELEGVEVWLMADFFATQISRTSIDELLGHPLLIFRTTPESSWHSIAKMLLDFTGSFILLSIFGIFVFPIVAIAIKLSSPGPIFFRQQRSGQNGRPFTLFKFRTMVTNAEQYKHELEAMNEMSGPVFKLTNDPRVTAVGRFLRKYSLDELPQLWNVLRGDMSLVGPRPLPVDEVKRFSDLAHRRRLSVKPGLTCLWQIGGRNQIFDFKEWVRLDLEYIDNWSLWLDVKILLLTIPAVLRGTGAK
ncbi:MAG TPA: sugar transferase [Verrucomicrobiae bacterium]|jgi:exopolysaccharide biosynthesis polyprenyl glycosylphosphotransferase|nr:sugar transferase [Verrucomicrobiae bacterium]